MAEPRIAPALFFDFDNTVTRGDVLDRVIERFSVGEAWREWEARWQEGRMSTVECLTRQVGDLRVTSDELFAFLAHVEIDPHFERIVAWASERATPLQVLSDNFKPLIEAILDRHGLGTVTVVANELAFDGDRLEPRFPWRDPACPRCAHCKARHLRASAARPRIFVGDGLSDVCPSLIAEEVFAKDSLAETLSRRRIAFRGYKALDEVLAWLEECEHRLLSA
jgi:2-hydroxy-3-keto-5-methylthiopentenyl-1-phosphate phosphatase